MGKTILEAMKRIFSFYDEKYVQEKDDFDTDFVVITDEHFRLLDSIRNVLSENQYFELTTLLQKLKMAGTGSADAYGWEYAEEIAFKYFEPMYREYGNQMLKLVFEQVLRAEFVELYNIVVGEARLIYFAERIESGWIIFKDDGHFQEAYDKHRKLLCKGELNGDEFTGYKCTKEYDGEYINSMRQGTGDELSNWFNKFDIQYDNIRRSGQWQQNRFIEGIIYSAVVFLNDSGEYELLESDQVDDLITADTRTLEFLISSDGWIKEKAEHYYFANVGFSNGKFNILRETLEPFQNRYTHQELFDEN